MNEIKGSTCFHVIPQLLRTKMRMFFSKGSPVISCAIKLLVRLRTSRAGNASHMAPTYCQEKAVSAYSFQDNKMFYTNTLSIRSIKYFLLPFSILEDILYNPLGTVSFFYAG